jgi:hypothetical protein
MPQKEQGLPLVEPVPIDDDLCSAIALIEPVWIGARLVFVAEQTCHESGSRVLQIKRKVVLPLEALEQICAMALRHVVKSRGGAGGEF